MRNTSGVAPLGRAVLVEYYEPERKGGLVFVPDNVKDRSVMVEQRCLVIEIGPAAWPDEAARAKPGDRVLIAKYSGYAVPENVTTDGKRYRLVNDIDIFARITSSDALER